MLRLSDHTDAINDLGGIEARFKDVCFPGIEGGGCWLEKVSGRLHLEAVLMEGVVAGIGNTW